MPIPEEDLGPRWLRDYQSIEADISQMEEFAATLASEVRDNYATHLPYVSESMAAALPPVSGHFPELLDFMNTHHQAQVLAHTNVYNFRDGTGRFAVAAQEISQKYRGSDAFSRARVNDIERALGPAATSPLAPGTTTDTPPTTEVY